MPTITLSIPPAGVGLLNTMLARRGFTGTNAEKLAEIKRLLKTYLQAVVRQDRHDAKLEEVVEVDLEIT